MSDQYVQSLNATGTSTASVTLTGVVAGNVLGAFGFNGSGATPATHSVADGQATYTPGVNAGDATDNVFAESYSLKNANAGSHTITFTTEVASVCFICAFESGGDTTATITTNAAFQSSPGAGANALNSGNCTASQAGTLVGFAADCASVAASDEPTAGTSPNSFTSRANNANSVMGAWRLESAAVSATAAATAGPVTTTDRFITLGIFIPNAAAAIGASPPDPRLVAYGRRIGTVQGRALFGALHTIEYVFGAGTQPAVSAADGSSTGSAAGTIAVGAATQTTVATSAGAASGTVAVGAATQKADAVSAGDASGTVATSNQTVSLATPLYPDPRYLTYGRLLGTPLMRVQAVLNWVIAPPAVAQTQVSSADGSSTGAATAVAVGASSQSADFSSAGSATATTAVGASTQKADFTAAGIAVPIAVGVGVTTADASSTAAATAIAISASKQIADALSQGVSTPIAVGAASQKADATSAAGSGASTIMVATTPFSAADGSSAGAATAVGTGASTASGAGLVIAGATPVAVSQATQAAAASSAGSAAGTTADATAPSPPIVVTLPTGITLEGGGAAQKWLHAKGDKKRRMARIERQDVLDIMELAQFAPQVQAYFAGRGGLPHAAHH